MYGPSKVKSNVWKNGIAVSTGNSAVMPCTRWRLKTLTFWHNTPPHFEDGFTVEMLHAMGFVIQEWKPSTRRATQIVVDQMDESLTNLLIE